MPDAHRFLMRDRAALAARGKDWFRIENKKTKANEETQTDVFIYDEIGFWGTTAADFVQQLAQITTQVINLHLSSPGGSLFDGVAIYQSLKGHSARVDVYIDSLAASAASFIAMAGENVYIGRNATMMIHDGLAMVYGNAKDMLDTSKLLDKMSDNVADIYYQKAGGSAEEWRALMKEEVWYNAKEAVDAKLADEIFEVKAPATETDPEDFALLDAFQNSSRKTAPSPEEVRRRVINRVKEARMSTQPGAPSGEGDDDQTATDGQNPEGQEPEGQQPEGQQPEGGDGADGAGAGESGTVPEVPTGAPAPQNTATAAPSGTLKFTIGGQEVTDPTAVQNYINSLEGAARETKMQNRKEFVQGLAASNKITAPQMTQLEEFVADLSDKQYETWRASWDAAPSQTLLGDHAGGAGQSVETTAKAKADEDKVEIARAIVKQHKLSNMAPDKIMATESYKTVIAADPEFKL